MPLDLIRLWKDAWDRQSFSSEDMAGLPEHPAGTIELTDKELQALFGGSSTATNQINTNDLTGCFQSVLTFCVIAANGYP